MERAKQKLTSAKTEWEHRVTELRMIRLIALEQLLFEYSAAELRKFAPAFNTALADLRSTVTREACVTGKFFKKQRIKLEKIEHSRNTKLQGDYNTSKGGAYNT